MSLITAEIGSIASAEVQRILGDATRGRNTNEVVTADPTTVWDRVVAGGWLHITAPEADTGAGIREIQEVARVQGIHLVSIPLVTTMLVARWYGPPEQDLESGVTFALPAEDVSVVPHGTAGRAVFGADGRATSLGDDVAVDALAASLPLAVGSGVPPVSQDQAREAAAVLAAEAVGCADVVLERSLAYAATREQFGRPISSFQAVRHHLANMHVAREEAWTAALAAGNDANDARRWTRLSLERSRTVVELGIQVHGGVGFTWEAGIHNWLRHVLALQQVTGGVA